MDIYQIILTILTVVITGLGIAVTKLSGGKKQLATALRVLAIGSADVVKNLKEMGESDKKTQKVLDKEKILK